MVRTVACAGMLGCSASSLLAQTWDGGSGVDSNWNTAANWLPDGVPVNTGAANLIFGGITRLSPVVNIPFDISSLVFNSTAGAFTIGGAGQLTIRAGGITNNDASLQSFTVPIIVPASQTWSASLGPLSFGGSSILLNADLVLNAAFPVTISAPLLGAGPLTKSGGNVLTLANSTPSTGFGTITISGGTIRPTLSNTLSDLASVIVGAVGTLDLQTNNVSDTIARLSSSAGGAVNLGAGTLTVAQNGAVSATMLGTISGAGNFTKSGTHTQVFSGDNTYTGTTTVNAGVLQITANERLANTSDLVIAGGEFSLQGFTETVDQFQITGGSLTGAGTLVANSFDVQGGIIQARLSGAADFTKSNTSLNTVFNGTGSAYTGNTNIIGGTLVTNAQNVLPDTTVVAVTSPGTLQVTNFSDTVRGISGNGTINILDTTLTINDGGASFTFNGAIGDLGVPNPGNLAKSGNGTLTLAGPCSYAGTTTLNAGSLWLGAPERLSDASDIVINGGQFVVVDETVDRFTINGGELRPGIIGVGRLRATQYSVNSGFTDCILAGPGGVVKAGAGTMSIAAPAPNTQAFTRVDQGVLSISASQALGTGNFLLNGGTLQTTAPMTIANPFSVAASSTIDCLADTVLANFAPSSSGPLTKVGPGSLSIPGAVPGTSVLATNSGDLLLGPASFVNAGAMSTAAAGRVALDGGLVTVSGSFSHLGELALSGNARLSAATFSNSGTIAGSGRLTAGVTSNPAGSIRLAQDDSLHLASLGAFTNAGLLEVIGGSVEVDGPTLNSASTGLIFARNATLRFDGNLTNNGSLAFSFGTSDVFGDITNSASGSIVLSGFANVTFAGDVVNNGSIRTSAGAASVFFGAVSGAGSFPGTGTVFMEGDLRPGNSPAEVEFEGDLVLGLFAETLIELGGTGPGQSDRLLVGHDASIDGDLTVTLIGGFRPTGSFVYPIVIAGDSGTGTCAGEFFRVTLPSGVRGMHVRYTPTSVELVYCQADFNSDGFWNSHDFFDFIAAFFALQPAADFNQDGFINSQDFFDFLAVFFTGC